MCVVAQLNHGNIVQVIDHGTIDGQYYMAMEYVHGENLMEVLLRCSENREALPLDLLLYVASCVSEGMDYAHRKQSLDGRPLNIVHRDISPHNVMISFQGEVKVADFGVARAAEQTHETVGGELRGKISYMSPEQAYGQALDHRSDIFSMGVVLYEALAGRGPFMRENPLATLDAVRGGQTVALSVIRPDIPQAVTDVVSRAMQPDPNNRFATSREMYEALQLIIQASSVSPFTLGDFMQGLFPENVKREVSDYGERTAAGRRAERTASTPSGDALVKRTLFYLKKRHPEGATQVEEWDEEEDPRLAVTATHDREVTAATSAEIPSPKKPMRLLAVAILLTLGAAIAGVSWLIGSNSLQPAGSDSQIADTADAAPRLDVKRQAAAFDQGIQRPARDSATPKADSRTTVPIRSVALNVDSKPRGAKVSLDGRPMGVAPLRIRARPGRHTLGLSLAGHKPLALPIKVGSKAQRLSYTLVPLRAELQITSTHPCRISIDGKSVGGAPVKRTLPTGALVIRCVNALKNISARRRVTLQPGKPLKVAFRFGALAVNVEPWATVLVNGKKKGTTPLMMLLPEGEHRVTLTNTSAGKSRKVTVAIKAKKKVRISSW